MAACFNLKNSEISKELLVNKLDNLDRPVLNDQSITSSDNELQRSPGFIQKQPPDLFCKKRCS